MKTSPTSVRFALAATAVFVLFTETQAKATAYYWKGGTDWAFYDSLFNWSTESATGADASALPGSGDTVNQQSCYFDMNGSEATLGSKTEGSGSGTGQFRVRNGILHIANAASVQNAGGYVLDGGTLIIDSAATLTLGLWNGGPATFNVNDRGTLQVDGKLDMWNGDVKITSGGTFILNGKARFSGSGSRNARLYNQGGSVIITNGLANTTSANTDTPVTLRQTSGSLTLGGDIDAGNYRTTFTVSGGSIHVISDCAVRATTATMSGTDLAIDVDEGVTFAAGTMTIDPTSTISKTGGGTFSIPPTSATIVIQNGSLGLASAASYDLSSISLGSGASATIALTTFGARVDTLPAALANATFTADLSTTAAGAVVFYSSDPTVLAKVKTDLAPSVPQGFDLVISGESLSLEEVSDYIFNSPSVSDLLSGAGWSTGTVPPANAAVSIDGANVVAQYASGTLPAWASIEVKNGATLRITADAALPAIILNKTATLDIASGTTTLANGLTGVALVNGDNVTLPVLSIQTNATLSVAPGMKFKNVDFRLYGTVAKDGTDTLSPTFGYAESGETTYFAFVADGGTFDFHANNNSGNYGAVFLICPVSGGTVIPVGTIVLRNAKRTVKSWADFGNWEFGSNNPTTVPFDVLVDGTRIELGAYFYIGGAAHLSLVNGSCIQRAASCAGHYFGQAIRDSATIVIGEGCFYDFTTGDGNLGIDSQSAVDAITVRDGGIYNATYNSSGWVRGVFVGDGGILGVSKIYGSRARTDLLRGFGSARIDGGLTIASINGIGHGGTDWDRHVNIATNVVFTGAGNVVVSNGVPEYPFSVTFRNRSSTATGTIGVAEADGIDTKLYFDNLAKWAGTVISGGVLLTNILDAASPTSVSFGGVDLKADLPVRIWTDGTSDRIDVGANGWVLDGGQIAFEPQDGDPAGSETWTLGTAPATSPLPTATRRVFTIFSEPIDGNADLVTLKVKARTCTTILLR